jgi:hypothetical protein
MGVSNGVSFEAEHRNLLKNPHFPGDTTLMTKSNPGPAAAKAQSDEAIWTSGMRSERRPFSAPVLREILPGTPEHARATAAFKALRTPD